MDHLAFTSIQAPNQDFVGRSISQYVGRRLAVPTSFVDDKPWQAREALLDQGEIQIGWICGLPYIWKADRTEPAIELLAAPVMKGERYLGKPVYFSDVLVHRGSPFRTFGDLRGAIWAYNEPNSHSGYNITRYHLATLGEKTHYFGRVVEAGSHQAAIDLLLEREIDASAIDSTVLEIEFANRPQIKRQLRLIETLGPSPIPPWVISRRLAPGVRATIRQILLTMHLDQEGQAMLERTNISRFVRVTDRDYDPIRQMAQVAADVVW